MLEKIHLSLYLENFKKLCYNCKRKINELKFLLRKLEETHDYN